MRNLSEYPITNTDIFSALEDAQQAIALRNAIGGLSQYSLFLLKEYCEANPESLTTFLKQKEING